MPRSSKREQDLAGESSRQLETLLGRQAVRSRRVRKLSAPAEQTKGAHRSVCGAPAAEPEELSHPATETGKKVEEDTWEDVEEATGHEDKNEPVVISLPKQDPTTDSEHKPKRRGRTFTKHDRLVCQEIHRTHLLFLLARGRALSTAADDLMLQSVALSLVPVDVDTRDPGAVIRLVKDGFRGAVRPVSGEPEGIDGNVIERLAKGPEICMEQLTLLSAALLRGKGIPTRIMWALQPVPLRPEDVIKQQSGKVEKKRIAKAENKRNKPSVRGKRAKTSKKEVDVPARGNEAGGKNDVELEQATAIAIEVSSWANENKDEDDMDLVENQPKATPSLCPSLGGRYWLEVYSYKKESWETLHLAPPPVPLVEPYVIAFNGRGAKDLTKKYVAQGHLARITPQRDEAWWAETMSSQRRAETAALRELLEKHRSDEKGNVAAIVAKASEREDTSIVAKEQRARQEVPTTIKGFQKHEQYVLNRHIKAYEVLRPGAHAVGTIKGESYFNRSDVCIVHTAEKWKRQGRIVKETELDKPAKLIKKRGVQQTDADTGYLDPSSTSNIMSSFYGPWQTEEWEMPSAKNGVVPKNEWGSVEIPPLAHALPGGTAHVDLPDAAKVCRQIGIDFADAVSGFEYKKRRMVPTKCGVVVCVENEELLRSAWSEYIRHAQQVAKERRLREGEAAWRDVLAAALTHIRVHRSFADDAEAALLEHASMKNDIKGHVKAGVGDKKSTLDKESLEANVVSDEVEEI